MSFLRKNFAKATIALDISNTDTQLIIVSGHSLPIEVGVFPLVIWDAVAFSDPSDDAALEIVHASYSGVPNVYDITRAQESTLAVAHSLGNRVALHYTAGMSEDDLTDAVITHEAAFVHADIALNTTHRGLVVGNPHNVTVGDIGASPTTHRHDGDTLEHDAVNSDGGAFSFSTTGLVTFNQSVKSANYEASNKLTVAATNPGEIDFTASNKKLDIEDNAIVDQDYSSDASPVWAGATIGSVVIPGVYTATEEPTGFVDHTATLSWVDGNRTLTITGNHDIYIHGVKTTKTTDSIQIGDVTGLHWIYYDAAGTLSEQVGAPGFDVPLMATVYWNTTPGFDKGMAGEERHSFKMDHVTHEYLHYTVGSRYRSGLAGTFDNTTITIEAGIWYDEDIEATPAQQTTCNVLYKNGSAAWEWDAGASVYYKLNGANLRYNNGNNLADCSGNRYMAMWIFITNDITTPVVALMGQRQDITLANARANNKYELLSLGDLPFEEMKLLYRVILRNTGIPPTYTEALDMRSVSNLSTGTYIATAHSTLTGLTTGDDHSQYLLADGTRALAGAWDMGSQALTNVNIDSGVITGITDLAIADGGTGQSTAQAAINALTNVAGGGNEHVLTKDTGTGNAIWKADAFTVKIDAAATAGYIGAGSGNGILRTSTGIKYTDGGDFVTLGLDVGALTAITSIDEDADYVMVYDATDSTHKKMQPRYLACRYVYRGDPVNADFTEASMTTDGTWRDLDLSGIIPINTQAIDILLSVYDDAADSSVILKKKGQTNSRVILGVATQGVNVVNYGSGVIVVDSNRKLQYLATNTTFSEIRITVKGWWV